MKLLRKLFEREMSSEEMGEETKLHKKIPMSSFVKQYGKERGKKIYYATVKRMAMKENNNSSEDSVIVEKEGKKKRGSPWFRDKDNDKLISRNHPNRSYMSYDQIAKRKKIYTARLKKFVANGGNPNAPAPNRPAMTMREVIAAGATRTALGKKTKTKRIKSAIRKIKQKRK